VGAGGLAVGIADVLAYDAVLHPPHGTVGGTANPPHLNALYTSELTCSACFKATAAPAATTYACPATAA